MDVKKPVTCSGRAIHWSRDNSEGNVQSSMLGLQPGKWPERIKVPGPFGVSLEFTQQSKTLKKDKVIHVNYSAAGIRLNVFDD